MHRLIGLTLTILVLAACGDSEAVRAAKAEAAVEERRQGMHCLSAWDGSHRDLARTVKGVLREPDSFEHIETRITPVDEAGDHVVAMQYRAPLRVLTAPQNDRRRG